MKNGPSSPSARLSPVRWWTIRSSPSSKPRSGNCSEEEGELDIKCRMVLGMVLVALAGLATAQENQPQQIVVPLTRPDEPGRLILERHQGSISVKGYEGNVVLIKAFLRRSTGTAPSARDAAGLKPVSAAAT